MSRIALAIAAYAVIAWAQAYAPMYQWIQELPAWLGHIFFGIMFLAAVGGIIKVPPWRRGKRADEEEV